MGENPPTIVKIARYAAGLCPVTPQEGRRNPLEEKQIARGSAGLRLAGGQDGIRSLDVLSAGLGRSLAGTAGVWGREPHAACYASGQAGSLPTAGERGG